MGNEIFEALCFLLGFTVLTTYAAVVILKLTKWIDDKRRQHQVLKRIKEWSKDPNVKEENPIKSFLRRIREKRALKAYQDYYTKRQEFLIKCIYEQALDKLKGEDNDDSIL